MEVKALSLGVLGTNCYIVYNDGEALIVDPGGDAELIIDYIEEQKLTPLAILLTHAHFDHIGGVEDLRKRYSLDLYIHALESSWLDDPKLNRSAFSIGEEIRLQPASHFLNEGKLSIGSFTFEVKHTPGHSPGSVSFIFNHSEFIIGGDVLFQRGIGRTDLPGGNLEELVHSIQHTLYQYPEHFVVYPGHGPKTTIGEEMVGNPFVRS